MKRIVCASLAALVLALCGGVLVLAGQTPGGDGLTPRGAIMQTLVRLDLTDAQKREVADVFRAHQGEGRAAFERVRAAAADFDKVAATPGVDEASLRRAFQTLAAAGEEAVVVKNRIMAEVRAKLTPKQQQVLATGRDHLAEKVRERVEAARAVFEEWIGAHARSAG